MEKVKESEDKCWVWEVLFKLYFMPSKFVKKYNILYMVFLNREVGPCQQKTIIQYDKVNGMLNQIVWHKKNARCLKGVIH